MSSWQMPPRIEHISVQSIENDSVKHSSGPGA